MNMQMNDIVEFNRSKRDLLKKWHDREHYSNVEGYRNREEFSKTAKCIREKWLPQAVYHNKLCCPKCKIVFDDINNYQYILEYCDDCDCDLEIDNQELNS